MRPSDRAEARRVAFRGDQAASEPLVRERSQGACELCRRRRATVFHHRRSRSIWRDGKANLPANLLHLCGWCHAEVHRYPVVAREHGWIVSRFADPTETPWRPMD